MSLRDYPDTTACRTGEHLGHGKLSLGVQVGFGLLHVNKLARAGSMECHQDRQRLRNTDADVCDVHHVFFIVGWDI